MRMVFRGLSVLIGIGMLLSGARWHIDPAAAAEGLGMTLLSGMGASTQIGDISAFFIALAVMVGLGQRSGQAHWLLAAALLAVVAAAMRTLAFLTGNAPLGTQFIVPELVMAGILFMAARTRLDEGATTSAPAS